MAGGDVAERSGDRTVQELFDLSGRVVLISGASGYLGTAMSHALADCGASAVASSRHPAKLQPLLRDLPPARGGPKHLAVAIDHMDPASAERGFNDAVSRAGRVDVLVNNGHEGLGADWRTVTPEQFTRQLANATGYFQLARMLRDHAVSRGAPGNVVMIGSMYGLVGSYPDAYEGVATASPAAYHTLKGGIIHMTRHLAVYWAKDRVRVNCLSPGPFPSDAANRDMVARLEKKVPMG